MALNSLYCTDVLFSN